MKMTNNYFRSFRTGMVKLVLVVTLIATGGAIALASVGKTDFYDTTATVSKKKTVSIFQWIEKTLHCPDFIGTEKEKVEIWLHVDESGALQVQRIKTENSMLAYYIMQKLNGRYFELSQDEMNKDYHFAIRFQII